MLRRDDLIASGQQGEAAKRLRSALGPTGPGSGQSRARKAGQGLTGRDVDQKPPIFAKQPAVNLK